jgi:hypothetical protein
LYAIIAVFSSESFSDSPGLSASELSSGGASDPEEDRQGGGPEESDSLSTQNAPSFLNRSNA